ncbi:hypothetical protein AAG906_021534 [Vitis piasezkii]
MALIPVSNALPDNACSSFSNSMIGYASASPSATSTIVPIVDNIVSTTCTHVVQPITTTMSQPLLHTSTNIHSMQTMSKSGIYKPKVYTTVVVLLDHFQEPLAKYSTFVRNGTWRLVPKSEGMHILKADDSLDKFKAKLIAKGFNNMPIYALIHFVIQALTFRFALKTLVSISYFLRFEAFRDSSDLYLNQSKYISDLLVKKNMVHAKPSPTPMVLGRKLLLKTMLLFRCHLVSQRPSCSPILNFNSV